MVVAPVLVLHASIHFLKSYIAILLSKQERIRRIIYAQPTSTFMELLLGTS